MKVSAVYAPAQLPCHDVIRDLDGNLMMFRISPYRKITEQDLSLCRAYRPQDEDLVPQRICRLYGLETCCDE